jgi:hypothetical protein
MPITLNEFLKKSLNLIDDQDIDRELNSTQIKFASDMFKKDLDIADLDQQITSIDNKTREIKASTRDLKNKLNLIKDAI